MRNFASNQIPCHITFLCRLRCGPVRVSPPLAATVHTTIPRVRDQPSPPKRPLPAPPTMAAPAATPAAAVGGALPPYTTLATIATCSLDQWALDWDGNMARIEAAVARARAAGARYVITPELSLQGYGVEDHQLEPDTLMHTWQSVAALLRRGVSDGLLVDVGGAVLHRGVLFNCRLFLLDGRVVLIRPKTVLANDGNYRETRWFSAYTPLPGGGALEAFPLPPEVAAATAGGAQATAPFGVGVLAFADGATLASETCEELFAPSSPHTAAFLDGVDVVSNGSGSHHELRKLHTRVDLMRSATLKGGGGVYVYSNQQGCDGGRLYFDGCAMVVVNGGVVGQGSQFSLRDVEVVTATVDLGDVRASRAAMASRSAQAAAAQPGLPRVALPGFALCHATADALRGRVFATPPAPVRYLSPPEEIALGPACWLWDWLRRSGGAGYFLPLSGGADSASSAALVGVMTRLLHAEVASLLEAEKAAAAGTTEPALPPHEHADRAAVLADLRRVVRDPSFAPASARDIAHRLLHTTYMGTTNSSAATRARAAAVCADLGGYHLNATIDAMVAAVVSVFVAMFGPGRTPRFAVHGGTRGEDLALQNIQARLRMVLAYFLAQLLPWVRGTSGFLLVLGSANVDEALRGYLTKYDCSSADINPIGGIAKGDINAFLLHAAATYGWPSLADVVAAPPSAELVPIVRKPREEGEGAAAAAAGGGGGGAAAAADDDSDDSDEEGATTMQLDEVDMGMSYEDLGWFGKLRKVQKCGPYSMYLKLLPAWGHLAPAEVAAKVKRFFYFYAVNRHKLTTLTPSYHAESYSPEDNRFDLRPFLYPTGWTRAFAAIDADVALREKAAAVAAQPAQHHA